MGCQKHNYVLRRTETCRFCAYIHSRHEDMSKLICPIHGNGKWHRCLLHGLYAAVWAPKVMAADRRNEMTLGTVLLILLILLLVGAIPSWPYSRSWGYAPSGGLGLVLLIVIVLFVLGRI
jgi:hypothetical protein